MSFLKFKKKIIVNSVSQHWKTMMKNIVVRLGKKKT